MLLLRYLDTVPLPREADCPQSPLYHERPCLAVIPAEVSASSVPHDQQDVNGLVQFYSFPSNTIVHSLTFQSRVLSLRTSKRIIVVAVDAQVCICRWSRLFFTCSCSVCEGSSPYNRAGQMMFMRVAGWRNKYGYCPGLLDSVPSKISFFKHGVMSGLVDYPVKMSLGKVLGQCRTSVTGHL
jgi:hypothetical protein